MKDEIENYPKDAGITLQQFENPDEEIIAYESWEGFCLEIGTDMLYEADDMSDDEIEDWANEQGFLDNEEDGDYLNEDGSLDMESLRSAKKEHEEEYSPEFCTPSGRAFSFFESKCFDFPENIKIDMIDGASPSNDWIGVTVDGISSLQALQAFLLENGLKVNFAIKNDDSE